MPRRKGAVVTARICAWCRSSARVRRPSWLLITRIESDVDRAFDSASFRCKRCTRAGTPAWGLGSPDAIAREAADHVLAHHGDDPAAVAWARDTLPAALAAPMPGAFVRGGR